MDERGEGSRVLIGTGGLMIGLGGVVALFADVPKLGYSKRSLYRYLHGQRKIPRYLLDQLPDEDETEWYDGRYRERI